jgi:hypothetical protein
MATNLAIPADPQSPPRGNAQPTDDRFEWESDVDAIMRHMLENREIEDDQRAGWDRWWLIDRPEEPRDAGRAPMDDARDVQPFDRDMAIRRRDIQPQGGPEFISPRRPE